MLDYGIGLLCASVGLSVVFVYTLRALHLRLGASEIAINYILVSIGTHGRIGRSHYHRLTSCPKLLQPSVAVSDAIGRRK